MSTPTPQSSNPFAAVWRELRALKKQITEGLSSPQRLERATIGKGGIRVTDGGLIEADGGIVRSKWIFVRCEVWPTFIGFWNDAAGTRWQVGDLESATGESGHGLYSSWSPLLLRSDQKDVRLDHVVNTTLTANAALDATTGRIYRGGSALRWKDDIQDVELDLDDVRWFIETCGKTWQGIYDPEGSGRGIGDIADWLAERPTLRQFVVFDAEGQTENIKYDRLYIVLARFLRDLDQRTAALEQANADLADRLDALEGGDA